MMKADPILRELWKVKDDLAEECSHDLRRLFERLKASQGPHSERLINRAKDRSVSGRPPKGRQDEARS
jgi:hypothetical protein